MHYIYLLSYLVDYYVFLENERRVLILLWWILIIIHDCIRVMYFKSKYYLNNLSEIELKKEWGVEIYQLAKEWQLRVWASNYRKNRVHVLWFVLDNGVMVFFRFIFVFCFWLFYFNQIWTAVTRSKQTKTRKDIN